MEHERHLAFGRDDEKLCICSLQLVTIQYGTSDEENEIYFVFFLIVWQDVIYEKELYD